MADAKQDNIELEADGLPPVQKEIDPTSIVNALPKPVARRINLTIAIPTKLEFKAHTVVCMLALVEHIKNVNVDMRYDILPGKSNIDQARSMLISKWYDNSKDGDLFMFLDSDQTFQPNDVYHLVRMLHDPTNPCDVACGAYSRSNNTLILGPENYVDFINGKNNKLVYGATGFMMITRPIVSRVYEFIKKENPDKPGARFYIDENYNSVIPFFKQRLLSKDNGIAKNDNEWLSEDYSFCYLVRLIGGTIRGFLSPSIGHVVPTVAYVDIEKDIQYKNQAFAKAMLARDPNYKGDLEPIKLLSKMNPQSVPQSAPQPATKEPEKPKLNITWGEKSIVYFTGQSIEPWGPKSLFTGLGGSETAVLELSRAWSKLGYEVIIYGNFTPETLNGSYVTTDADSSSNTDSSVTKSGGSVESDSRNTDSSDKQYDMQDWKNVKFLPFNLINVNDSFNVLILWRAPHLASAFKNYKTLLVDQHDVPRTNAVDNEFYSNITKYMVKSDYHKNLFTAIKNSKQLNYPELEWNNRFKIIPNGGSIAGSERLPYEEIVEIKEKCHNKLIYCSSYDRGLQQMLEYGWPIINAEYPDAELHIYYGWDYFDKFMAMGDPDGTRKRFKDHMLALFNKYPNVHEHGRVGKEELMNIKLHSNIHYYTGFFSEIDCISTRESMSVGCVPVVNNFGAFTDERKDYMIKIDGDAMTKESQEKYARQVVELLKNKEKLNQLREQFYHSKNLDSETWESVATEWSELF